MKFLTPILFLSLATIAVSPAQAEPARDALLSELAAAAKAEDGAFAGFSAERGESLFLANHGTGKPDTPACTSCHGADPKASGRTRAGKTIPPLAVSANPACYTDREKVAKWFGRNCKSVLGRECTPLEKGDFITFMAGQ